MSRQHALAALAGEVGQTSFGMAWAPPGVEPIALAASLGADFVFVDAEIPGATGLVAALQVARIAAFWCVSGAAGRLAQRLGWSELIRRSIADSPNIERDLRDAAGASIEFAYAGCVAGADAIVVADDLAGPSGWLLDPAFARDAVVPLDGAVAACAHDAGVPAVFHSDGLVSDLFGELAYAGFSAVHLAPGTRAGVGVSVSAAARAGLVPMGGVAAVDLGVATASVLAARVRVLEELGLMVVCDDGGMTGREQADALGDVFDAMRATEAPA